MNRGQEQNIWWANKKQKITLKDHKHLRAKAYAWFFWSYLCNFCYFFFFPWLWTVEWLFQTCQSLSNTNRCEDFFFFLRRGIKETQATAMFLSMFLFLSLFCSFFSLPWRCRTSLASQWENAECLHLNFVICIQWRRTSPHFPAFLY